MNGMKATHKGNVLQIYTDGSWNKKKNLSGFGVFVAEGHKMNKSVRLQSSGTNYDAEMQAVLQTLKELNGTKDKTVRIVIYTDFSWLLMGLRHLRRAQEDPKVYNLENMRRNRYYTPDFLEFLEKYDTHLRIIEFYASSCSFGVAFVYVPAHENLNEEADALAKLSVANNDDRMDILRRNYNQRRTKHQQVPENYVHVPYRSTGVPKFRVSKLVYEPPMRTIWKQENPDSFVEMKILKPLIKEVRQALEVSPETFDKMALNKKIDWKQMLRNEIIRARSEVN